MNECMNVLRQHMYAYTR